jgi:hypothetical protein
VVTVFHEHFGQGECQAIYLVQVALEEQHTTLLIGHWSAIRELWGGAESIQDWLFVVVTRDTVFLTEHTAPFVSTLIVYTVKTLVQNRFYD